MSGKSKQRTKGNVKPSSSGRAAALISKDGTVGFVGFGLMGSPGASNLGYVPMTAGSAEDVDASVDSEFRMVMRKLMKRDAVTKLKAIQEFTDLCKNSTVAAVESALPFWPRLFNKLSMDVDHRVREATQQAMEQLVLRVGRNLAPHLRYVIGPWLCSQFDTYAVVASSGRKSFQAAFSDEKQAEVIMFCRKELFEFLQDNILTQTPSTLSDPKFVSEEERDAKYNRVLSSSILALGKLISVTSEKAREEMEELYLSLLREKKFWKYTKHKSPNVRGAVFSTVSIACEMRPSLMLSLSCHVSPAVLSALDDSDPAVCQHLWNAVLSVVKNIADCWKQVNVRKAVLPKLWSVLKNGGSGCASIIFPNLLPFLSKVPSEVVGSGLGFYQELFSNLQEGLSKERVQNSLSECSAVVLAFMECLQFCLLHEFGGEGPHETVQEYLIKEQLLVLMKSSLEKRSSKMMQSSVYTHASDLLSFLSIKCEVHNKTVEDSESDGQKDSQPFSPMLKWFWDGLSFLCMKYVQSTSHKVDMEYISSVSHCLITLKNPTTKNKKQHKVAFIESLPEHLNSIPSDSVLPSEKCCSVTDTQTEPVDVENLYNGCLLDLVCNVCNLCLDEIIQKNSLMHLSLLSWLVPHFTSEQLIRTLNKTSEHTSRSVSVDGNNYCELSEQFISQTLFPWMTLSSGQLFPGDQSNHDLSGAFTDSKSVEYVITIFCGIVRILPVEKQEELVSRALQQNAAVSFLYKLVDQGILSDIAGVVRWIQCPNGNEKLLGLSSRLVLRIEQNTSNDSSALLEDDRKTIWKLLKLYLVGARNVLMLEKNFVEKLFQHFLRILRQSELQSGEELLILLDILTTFLNNCERNPADLVPSTQDLLLAVFQLQLTDTNHVSTTVSQALTETWQTGLKVCRLFPIEVDSTPCQTLLLTAATVVQDKLLKMDTLESVENIVIKAVCLLKDASLVNAANDSADETLTQKLLNALTPKERELNFFRNGYSLSQWLLPPVLERNLPIMSAVYDQLDESQSTTATLNSHQKMILFCSSLTKEILSDSDESFSGRSVMVARESLVGLWLEMSWVRHWCSCVLGSSCSTEEFSPNICDQAIYNLLLKLQKTSNYLLEHIKNKDWCGALLVDALTRSRTEGFLWCLVLEGVLKDLQQLGVSFDPALLLAEVQPSASLEEKECQTLNTLLSHVNGIYELKVVTERFTWLLCEVTDESGFARLFSTICGSLQQWFRQTEGSEEALLECQLTAVGILDELVEWNKTHENLLLINSSLDDTVSMSVLTVNLSLIRILQMAVLQCPDKMNSKHWDFLLCSLAGWLQTCEENRSNLTSSLKCVALCCQVCSLFCTVARFFEENASKLTKISLEEQSSVASREAESTSFENTSSMTGDVAEFPPNLCAEWQGFFSGTLFTAVLQLFLFHAAECQSAHFEASPWSTRISNSLGLSVAYTPVALLREHKFEGLPYGDARASLNVPRWIGDLMGHCSPLLKCGAHGLQFAAYYLLAKVMADISVVDDKVAESEQTGEEPVRSPPTPLIKLINSTCGHMMEMMGDAQVPFGEHLDMTGDTEVQNVSLALMLAWKLLLQLFRELPQEKRVEYAKYIRQNKMVDNLLGVLFRLIPLKSPGTVVSDDCEPVIGRFAGQRTIQVLASDVCYCLMQWMPAIVRQWWNSLDKRQSAIVDKFTISSITPQLCQREMQMVQNSSVRFDNMQVKTRPSAREVAAVYTVEEMSMELVVKLAPNHPLGVVSVDSGRKIGVAAAQWRSWMLQMTTFLTHQNGSIMDGLILWKRNVDKRFEGVDDCMICFSVIHGSNYSLPKLSCKTCKKKFHSACLYKWFSTSNNATCPLCRNLF